ncbi:MAG: hypothetical protein H7066_09810 [Cytophagaceae bacterium]|nr:hypothetical protein [Gemmatimonadaceae bacterium]
MSETSPSRSTELPRKVGLGIALASAALRWFNPAYWDFLDDLDLAIHEAGHVIFQPFGEPMLTLGGSLFQVIVPLAFVLYFIRSGQRFAAWFTLVWVGINLLNVAIYVGDARAQELPLLGGENTVHDWWYLLTEWDLLEQHAALAFTLRLAAALTFLTALGGGLTALRVSPAGPYPAPPSPSRRPDGKAEDSRRSGAA